MLSGVHDLEFTQKKKTPSVMERLKLQPPKYINNKEESKAIREFSWVLFFFSFFYRLPFSDSCVFLQGHRALERIGARTLRDVLEIMYSSPVICPCRRK